MLENCWCIFFFTLLYREGFWVNSETVVEKVYLSYDAGQTLEENFYGILGSICPQSVYCAGMNWVPNMTYVYSSETVRTARRDLMGLRDSLVGCCQHCSCDTDCQVTNNCCIDAEPAVLIGEAESSQLCLSTDLEQYRSPGTILHVTSFYHMVTKCPNVTSNVNITQQCESPNIAFIEEIVPVQSAETGLIYRNRFCAQCNGVANFSSWQVNAYIAKQVFNYYGQQVLQDLAKLYSIAISASSRAADLLFYPPHGENELSKKKRCFHEIDDNFYARCDSSTDAVNFIRNACSYKTVVFTRYYRAYNNLFCRICTDGGPIQTNDDSGCGSFDFKGPTNMIGILGGLLDSDDERFDAVKDLQVPSVDPITNCTCEELYDQEKNSCRQVHCAMGYVYIACKCVKLMKQIVRLPIMTVLRLRSVDSTEMWKLEETDKSSAVISAALKKIGNTIKASIGTLPYTLFRHIHKGEPTYDLLFELTVYQGWDTRDVVKTLFYKLQEGLMVRVKEMTFEMKLAPVGLIPIYEKIVFSKRPVLFDQQIFQGYGENMTLIHVMPDFMSMITPTMVFGKYIFCKRIIITTDELNLINDTLRSKQLEYDIDQSLSTDDQQLTYICLDDFINVFMPYVSKASSKQLNGIFWHLLVWLIVTLKTDDTV